MKILVTREGLQPTHLNVEIFSRAKLGDNRPVAFILPGGPGADLTAYCSYECLFAIADLVFHDPRGCGLSDEGDPDTYSMTNYIEDVESIRQALGLEKIIIIGKSYGAMCALGYALRYPNAVQKLVLAAGAPSYHLFEKAEQNLLERGTPEQRAIFAKLRRGNIQNREELLTYFRLTNALYSVKARTQPDAFDLVTKSERFAYKVLNAGFQHEYERFDYTGQLHQVSCPTLVLVGNEDWITDPSFSVQMAERIPAAKLVVFQHASHAMEADVPELYFQTIADFIA